MSKKNILKVNELGEYPGVKMEKYVLMVLKILKAKGLTLKPTIRYFLTTQPETVAGAVSGT